MCCCFIVDTKVQVLLSSSVILNSLSSWLLTLEQRWALMVFIFSTWSIKVFFSRIKSFNFMKVFDTLRTIRVPFLVVISLKGPSMSLLNNVSHQIYGQIYFFMVRIFYRSNLLALFIYRKNFYYVQRKFFMLFMHGTCHLNRPWNVEIGVEYQNIFVVVFFNLIVKCIWMQMDK